MDKLVKNILLKFNRNGYNAYLVGGFVRDHLLGKKSFDVDISTNATPEEITRLFKNYIQNENGVVKYKIGKYAIEIATMRRENAYEKRRPVEHEYVNDINVDYLRRDFTINAIYMDYNGNIIDPSQGINDLNKGIIRIIGDAQQKFNEDSLRILRAIRFSTILDFDIDESLLKDIKKYSYLVSSLSKFRITEELKKIFTCSNYKRGLELFEKTGIKEVLKISYSDIHYSNNYLIMLAQIDSPFYELSSSESKTISDIRSIKRLGTIDNFSLFNYGIDTCFLAGELIGKTQNDILAIYRKMPIKSLNSIKVNGIDIINWLGIEPSKKIGEIMGDIKKEILLGNLNNNKKDIKKYIMERYDNNE